MDFSYIPILLKVQDEKQAHQTLHETFKVLGIYLISYELTES